MSLEVTLYRDLLADIKVRVRRAQHKAAISASAEMILMYWDIGRMIAARQEREGWGAGVIPRLAVDLKNELPEQKGFSERNIKLMVQFCQTYPDALTIGQPPVAQISDGKTPRSIGQPPVAQLTMIQRAVLSVSWAHNVILIQKIKDLPTRLCYARQVIEHGWSRDDLAVQIKNRALPKEFASSLPSIEAIEAELSRDLENGGTP